MVLAVTDVIVCLYKRLPGTLGTSPFPAVLITLFLLSLEGFLWEILDDIISDVHAEKLFMNNIYNILFTLITETAFEKSFSSSGAFFQLLHRPKASFPGSLSGTLHKCFLGGFLDYPPNVFSG